MTSHMMPSCVLSSVKRRHTHSLTDCRLTCNLLYAKRASLYALCARAKPAKASSTFDRAMPLGGSRLDSRIIRNLRQS